MNNNIDKIIKESKLSLDSMDVPIGAIIVKDGVLVASGFNTREKNQNVLEHAEINCIIKAQNIFNNWNLSGCDMYVTLKPCSMCTEIIKQSGLRQNGIFDAAPLRFVRISKKPGAEDGTISL